MIINYFCNQDCYNCADFGQNKMAAAGPQHHRSAGLAILRTSFVTSQASLTLLLSLYSVGLMSCPSTVLAEPGRSQTLNPYLRGSLIILRHELGHPKLSRRTQA